MKGDVQLFQVVENSVDCRWQWVVHLDDDHEDHSAGLVSAGYAETASDARQDALTALQKHLGQPSARTHEIGAEIEAETAT